MVICGIVGGLLALKVQKAIIILSTSFAGSSQVVLSSICFVVGQTFTVNGPMPVAPYEAANRAWQREGDAAALWLLLTFPCRSHAD